MINNKNKATMHKYFNFTKIYEAEQSGEPLSPEEMGTPIVDKATVPVEDELKDFNSLAGDHLIELTLTEEDRKNLEAGQSITKTDAQWKKKQGDQTSGIIDIKSVIINLTEYNYNYYNIISDATVRTVKLHGSRAAVKQFARCPLLTNVYAVACMIYI